MFGQFFVLFAMMGVGYFCSQKKWITSEVNVGLGNLVLFTTIPALLFSSMARTHVEKTMVLNFVTIVGVQFISMVLFGRIMRWYYKMRKYDRSLLNMLEVTVASTNNAFIGLPIAAMFFGEEGIIYMSASVMGLNFYIWSFGLYIIKGVRGESLVSMLKTLLKGAFNPNISSIFLGLMAAIFGLAQYIPNTVWEFIQSLGNISTPLSLIYIGALAGAGGIMPLFREKALMETSLVKMVTIPLMAFVVALVLPLAPMVKAIYFVAMALPAAAIVPMVVGKYGVGVEMSSKLVLMSTVISMASLPVCIWISSIWV